MRLVKQRSRDPASELAESIDIHSRIAIQGLRHTANVLRYACAASRTIVCLKVLAGSAVPMHDRLRTTPASPHVNLMPRNSLARLLWLILTPITESLVAACGVSGDVRSGKLFPRSKLDWGFTALARLTEQLVKFDICRSPETVLALVICSWTVAIV